MKNLSFVSVLCMLASGCGLGEMHDKTIEMAGTTNKMAKTTEGMAKTTDGMAATTGGMAKTTEHMSVTTDTVAKISQHMSETTDGMAQITEGMSATTAGMAKTTNDMARTMLGMSDTTNKMAVTTDQMSAITSKMYLDMRIGNCRMARQDTMKGLDDSREIGGKLGYASQYYDSFEYQYWSPKMETVQNREKLMGLAAQEYFQIVRNYIFDFGDVGIAAKPSSAQQSLYALVATMHTVYPDQNKNLEGTQYPVVSMLSMIQDALSVEAKVEAGTVSEASLPQYQVEVLRQKQTAVYLLQVRQNFLKAFGFAMAASQDNGNQFTMIQLGELLAKAALGFNWTPNFDQRDSVQINFATEVFEEAAKTRNFLKQVRIFPVDDMKIELALSHMSLANLNVEQLVRSSKPADQVRGKALQNFAKASKSVLRAENQ